MWTLFEVIIPSIMGVKTCLETQPRLTVYWLSVERFRILIPKLLIWPDFLTIWWIMMDKQSQITKRYTASTTSKRMWLGSYHDEKSTAKKQRANLLIGFASTQNKDNISPWAFCQGARTIISNTNHPCLVHFYPYHPIPIPPSLFSL